MRTVFIMVVCVYSAPLLAFGEKEKTITHATGTITLRDGKAMQVKNITIKGKTEFYLYVKPTDKGIKQGKTEIQKIDGRINKKIYVEEKPVKTGPAKLRKGLTLTVPEPHTDYIFQDTIERSRTIEGVTKREVIPGAIIKYTEVILDGSHYLIKKRTTVHATKISDDLGITIEKISRLAGITITGTVTVEPEKKDTKKK